MGLFDWLKRRSYAAPTDDVTEAHSPTPREELAFIEPIGYGNEVEPLDKKDRKNPAAIISASLRVAQQRGRDARYRDFDAMDTSDIAAMLDATVDAVLTFEDITTGRGFKTESDNPKVQELLTAATKNADLTQLAEEVLRDMLKYGDAFVEPLFSGRDLVGAQTYRPAEMYVGRNDKGQLVKGKDDDGFGVAYQQKKNGTVVAGWQPWEIIHFRFLPNRKLLYSEKGLLDALRGDWRKLQMVEQGMVVSRVTRAYPRRIHYLDVTGKNRNDQEQTLRSYISRMTKRQFGRKPVDDDGYPVVDVSDDLYITTGYDTGTDGKPYPKLNKTEIEDPATAGLSELADVTYLRQKIWAQVPSDIVGIKRNTTTDLDSQDIAYTRLLRRCQTQLERGLRAIFDQVLLANGILPGTVEYRVRLPLADVRGSWKHADQRFRASLTLRSYLEMGAISRRYMLKQAYNLSDLEIDQMWDEISKEMSNPIFQALIAPARDGLPSVTGDVVGAINKSGVDGGAPTPTAPHTVTPDVFPTGITKSGVDRTTAIGQRLRGNMSGG